jgi:hypothetical protein
MWSTITNISETGELRFCWQWTYADKSSRPSSFPFDSDWLLLEQGSAAAKAGLPVAADPYAISSRESLSWRRGWNGATAETGEAAVTEKPGHRRFSAMPAPPHEGGTLPRRDTSGDARGDSAGNRPGVESVNETRPKSGQRLLSSVPRRRSAG